MSRKKWGTHCSECRKAITHSNPSYAGGGILDACGKWTQRAVCSKCHPPVTVSEIQNWMNEVFKASETSK